MCLRSCTSLVVLLVLYFDFVSSAPVSLTHVSRAKIKKGARSTKTTLGRSPTPRNSDEDDESSNTERSVTPSPDDKVEAIVPAFTPLAESSTTSSHASSTISSSAPILASSAISNEPGLAAFSPLTSPSSTNVIIAGSRRAPPPLPPSAGGSRDGSRSNSPSRASSRAAVATSDPVLPVKEFQPARALPPPPAKASTSSQNAASNAATSPATPLHNVAPNPVLPSTVTPVTSSSHTESLSNYPSVASTSATESPDESTTLVSPTASAVPRFTGMGFKLPGSEGSSELMQKLQKKRENADSDGVAAASHSAVSSMASAAAKSSPPEIFPCKSPGCECVDFRAEPIQKS